MINERFGQQSVQQGVRRNTFNAPKQPPKNLQEALERLAKLEEHTAQALGENFRDADDAQRIIPVHYTRELYAIYQLPLALALQAEPKGIYCMRCRFSPDTQLPTGHGTAVEFVWDGVQQRALISRIEGLTPGTQRYRFEFEVVG